jgi:gliding motility-associated-like protein
MRYGLIVLLGLSLQALGFKNKDITPAKSNGFEENKGQWPSQVMYKTDVGGERRLFMEKDRFTWVFTSVKDLQRRHDEEHKYFKHSEKISDLISAHAFRMIFVNAEPDAEVSADEPLPYYHNYFIGNDASKWASEVHIYSSVHYKNIYKGIDIEARYSDKQLKYDYIIKPGADASRIQLKFEGADNIYVSENRLYVVTRVGEMTESEPYSYQIINGVKVEVPCRYVLDKKTGEVSFFLPSDYDHNYELVIDPVIVAATHSGSTSMVFGHTATYDNSGNIYTGGRCFGQTYPVTVGAFQVTFGGYVDIAISKLNPAGSNLIWATFIGGTGPDYAHSMYVNDNFELYVYGTTSSNNYPTTPGCYDNTYNGSADIIVSKLNPTGTTLIGSTYVGGTSSDGNSNMVYNYGDDYRGEIVVNSNGEPYVVSNTLSNNFPVTAGAYDNSFNGGQDAVVLKMNPTLTSMIFSTYLGGSVNDSGYGIRLNLCGEVYIVGATAGNFPTTAGALNTNYLGGTYDGYVSHFNANCSTLLNSSYFGTSAEDIIYFIDIDVSNDVYVFGNTLGTIPVSPGTFGNPNSRNFLAKWPPSLNATSWTTVFGNGAVINIAPSAFMVDVFKNLYMCGFGIPTGYPVTPNALQLTNNGDDFYLIALSANAASLNYATFYGSIASEHVDGGTSRFNPQGIVYQAVCECGASIPTVPWAWAPVNIALGCDIGVFKIDFQNGLVPPANSTLICAGNTASISANIPTGIANPSFSYQPGGFVSNNPVFTVSPNSNTTYTLYSFGLNCSNALVSQTNVVTVSVAPTPALSPSLANISCTNNTNSVNLGVGFVPNIPSNYTVTWSPNPATFVPVNSSTAAGLTPGIQSVTVSTGGGCQATATLNVLPAPPPVSFSVVGPNIIDCNTPTVTMYASSNYTYGTLSFTWTSISFTANTQTVSVVQQGTYNVYGVDQLTGCSAAQSVAIGINTVAPTNSVNPVTQVITCSTLSPATFSGSVNTPTVNFTSSWYSPVNPPPAPPMSSCGTTLCPVYITSPGTYTFMTCNSVNGCCTSKTIQVVTTSAFPTYTIGSSTHYSVGCAPLNQTTLSIVNPVSTNTPQGTCSYAFLAPSYTGAPVFANAPTSTVTQQPGTWTVIVQDNSNNCETTVFVPIIQNTIAPNVSASVLTQTLNCYHPTVMATGSSTTQNTILSWLLPVTPPQLPGSTVVIGAPPNGPNTSASSLVYANYTIVATNTVNACQSASVVVFNQNFKPPVSSPTISIGTPTSVYCNASKNPVVLTTGSSTTTSGGGPLAFVANPCWQGPSLQTPTCGPSSYSCYVPGVYSLNVMDNFNGCTTTNTIMVLDETQPPIITNPLDSATLDCGSTKATLLTTITGSNGGLKYFFYHYPPDAAFSPSSAITPYGPNHDLSGTASSSVQVDQPGEYEYIVTNTLTGCKSFGSFIVTDGFILADFTPDPASGYAPLTVNFINNSATSLGNASVTSIWNFGNGTSFTSTNNVQTNASYNSAGTYTVMLLVQKGNCMDTVYKTIKVDLPSKLEVPNIFTPNGDGNNDVFFLKVANMGEIHAIIFDRWGNRVYETTSSTGNILWDGKNLNGKECSDGVYFYVITGNGKDDKHYEQKGNVSIYR